MPENTLEKYAVRRERIGEAARILLEYTESNITLRGANITEVPPSAFTDVDLWNAEIERVFKRLPLMLALSCEIPKPHDYKSFEAVGLPLLIVRDKSGVARTFLNVCAHRWSPVAPDGHGNCAAFVCPYHGWTYATDGKLVGVADKAKFGDIDQSRHGLRELPCEERCGMIFACLSDDATLDVESFYGGIHQEFGDLNLQDWTFLGSQVIDGPNWKLAVHATLDNYHFGVLHEKTVAPYVQSNVMQCDTFGPHMRLAFATKSIGALRDQPEEQWQEQEGHGCFSFLRHLFPNISSAFQFGSQVNPALGNDSDSGVVAFTQTFPGPTPDKSRMVLLYAHSGPPKSGAEHEILENYMNFTTYDVARDEDMACILPIQNALGSAAHKALLFGQNERVNQYFHEWLDWYLAGDDARPKPEF